MEPDRPHGKPLPTSKDVAALAGVAQSTVSYVMSGKRSVSPDSRRRVEDAITKLGYHPNQGARALRGARTNVIALVVHLGTDADLGDSLPYIDTVVEEARKRDFDVILLARDEGPQALERLARRRIADAFVLMDVRTHDPRLYGSALLGLPVVLFGRPEDTFGLDSVDFDTRRAGEMLAQELAATGHRHVVVFGDESAKDAQELRFIDEFHEGVRSASTPLGLTAEIVLRTKPGWAGVEELADTILAHSDDRLGLIARTPRATDQLLQLARIRGLEPGRDISILSLCTDATAAAFSPPVTNVSPEPRDLSRLAMRVLFERLDGGDASPRRELLEPAGLKRRASTASFD